MPEKVVCSAVDLVPEDTGSMAFLECLWRLLMNKRNTVNTAESQVESDIEQAGKGQLPIITSPRNGFISHTETCINTFQALKHFLLALEGPQKQSQVRNDLLSPMPPSHPH